MTFTVAVPNETATGERRVALDPATAERLARLGADIRMEQGAGRSAFYPDDVYQGVRILSDRSKLLGEADLVMTVQPPALDDIRSLKEGAILVGMLAPYRDDDRIRLLAERRITSFAMELLPRISRAQSMDVLSSQASVAGYKATLIAAEHTARFFPMLTTAAGTIRPAKVLVIGAGVAGLQAIATAKRLGAMVEAYDVRSATKEQVESLGAKFVDTGVKAEGEGGYARELTEEEKQQQQEVLARHIAQSDAVITTAAIPGRPAPRIIPAAMVDDMKPGAVIVDLAAETGGNCELTRPGERIETEGGVILVGPVNVPSMLAVHASEMYARNLLNFIGLMVKDGAIAIDWDDEILAKSVLTHDGEIKHGPTRERLQGETS